MLALIARISVHVTAEVYFTLRGGRVETIPRGFENYAAVSALPLGFQPSTGLRAAADSSRLANPSHGRSAESLSG